MYPYAPMYALARGLLNPFYGDIELTCSLPGGGYKSIYAHLAVLRDRSPYFRRSIPPKQEMLI